MSPLPRRVLLTSFGPFAGRLKNGSRTCGMLYKYDADPDALRHVALEVIWDEPARCVLPVVHSFSPTILIGLGEGKPGQIAIECRARNIRHGTDQRGRTCAAEPIDPLGPPERAARFSYTPPPQSVLPICISQDCGTFLCNEALYHYCNCDTLVVAFIHLPPQNDTPDETYYARIKPVLDDFIGQQLAMIQTSDRSAC